ncbi:MAG: 3',5'-cyclic-nucleotide phosphodiesterase [Planctomycetota bacterium]
MKLRVLGCHGGLAPGLHTTCYLLSDEIAIDAGALSHRLEVPALEKIRDIFLSHAHHDHVASLPSLVEYRIGGSGEPIRLHGLAETLEALRCHLFNDVLWPDFASIPGRHGPVIEYAPLTPGEIVRVGPLGLTAIPMQHTVPCVGYLVTHALASPPRSILVGSDTASLDTVVEASRRARGLRFLMVEVSFPDRLEALARESGHLCPSMLASSLQALPDGLPIYVTHLKPEVAGEVTAELAALPRKITRLEQDMELSW